MKTPLSNLYVHPSISNTTFSLTKLSKNDYEMIDSSFILGPSASFYPSSSNAFSTVLPSFSINFESKSNVSIYSQRF